MVHERKCARRLTAAGWARAAWRSRGRSARCDAARVRWGRRGRALDRGVHGTLRVGRTATEVAARSGPGDVALLDHIDLDTGSARELVAAGVGAVLNAAPGLSGRHPAGGTALLVRAGIPVLDGMGTDVFGRVRDGQRVVVDVEDACLLDDEGRGVASVLGRGAVQTDATTRDAGEAARVGLALRASTLAADAAELLAGDPEVVLDEVPLSAFGARQRAAAVPVPAAALAAWCRDRTVLLVQPGEAAAEVLTDARGWLRRVRPTVLLADAPDGAPAGPTLVALAAAGCRTDVLVGDLLTASEPELTAAALRVVRAPGEGASQGQRRIAGLGLDGARADTRLPATALGLAVALQAGAAVVVTAGVPAGLLDLLESGRSTAAALAVLRLRAGGRVVDLSAVAALLPPPGHPAAGPTAVLFAGVAAAATTLALSEPGRVLLHTWGFL